MAKFKVRLSLEKLELEIEGSRDDVPIITEAVGNQIAGLLVPTNEIVVGEDQTITVDEARAEQEANKPRKKNNRKTSRKSRSSSTSQRDKVEPIAWRNDPAKWGTPKQNWTTANKSIWILYVVSQEANTDELTATQITKTFNSQFKQAGIIQSNNVSRDLGKLKISNGYVSDDTSKDPPTWYLTQAGVKVAQELIVEARTINSDS